MFYELQINSHMQLLGRNRALYLASQRQNGLLIVNNDSNASSFYETEKVQQMAKVVFVLVLDLSLFRL